MSSSTTAPSIEPTLDLVESATSPSQSESESPDDFLSFSVKYSKSILSLRLSIEDSVSDLKAVLFSLTDVPPARQKIMGLAKGKLPLDETTIGHISFPSTSLKGKNENGERKVLIMLIGTPEADTFKDPSGKVQFKEDQTEPAADVDYAEDKKNKVPPAEDPENLAKLSKVISRFSDFAIMHPPRPGKGLLVLDLDYTLADTKRLLDPLSLASEAARPGLHDFLSSLWPYYDICVWSQTSWRWLEAKLTELNMLANPNYSVNFVLDRTPMFSIKSSKEEGKKHEVKALELIWSRFKGQYGKHNTVHIDDLSRNFAMNPTNGVKCKAYKNSPNFDTELAALKKYCLQLTLCPDISEMNHKHWKHFTGNLPSEGGAGSGAASGETSTSTANETQDQGQ